MDMYALRSNGDGKTFDSSPIDAITTRKEKLVELERKELTTKVNRVRTALIMKEARVMADDKKLVDAREKLFEAKNLLKSESNPLIEMHKSELQQLLEFMKSQDIYEKQGCSFALSSETSRDRQRFAARGDVEKLRLFATPWKSKSSHFTRIPASHCPRWVRM
ncbi:hypothetical protein Vadar_021564 [Vaccinium darrowii]|uniref:Uncharacterized protein n=1 Tax=Vaccinium darrowii TaxID=229202 RepID=A0ACB7YNM2_9ERIC|nr:hypothetical protein Vadar_021564 [Vaccinium darrowii]